ncbi:methylenetetrahydrofolate reductase [NAD(P)H] [Niameybacter massiliensis]|uniref:methylenetetrahydrofolate reductase [NAD(P)H] n=1 Tax=Niameybacter massiliensis TaxID=1658108 RepID=UPI0006B45AFC|nr:methylenetetrahydrofolate reductase [NAD(P)H] [Niameybacter massiliensis]
MKISEIFEKNKPVISFEIFPPKQTTSIDSIYSTIDALAPLSPDFISVTYGAGGSTRGNTVQIASVLKNKYNITPLAHLTCVDGTKESMAQILQELEDEGVENILALRGDLPEGASLGEFHYANDLVSYIKENGNFDVAAACYPEKHIEALTLDDDITHLKHKIECGTDVLISQLFFDNEAFYKWRDQVRSLGIQTPIVAGIMPITSAKQLERMVTLCGASIPSTIQGLVKAYNHNAQALKEAGIAYATMQIIDLLASGVDGIHLYTMNQADIAKRIMENIRGINYAVKTKRA